MGHGGFSVIDKKRHEGGVKLSGHLYQGEKGIECLISANDVFIQGEYGDRIRDEFKGVQFSFRVGGLLDRLGRPPDSEESSARSRYIGFRGLREKDKEALGVIGRIMGEQ